MVIFFIVAVGMVFRRCGPRHVIMKSVRGKIWKEMKSVIYDDLKCGYETFCWPVIVVRVIALSTKKRSRYVLGVQHMRNTVLINLNSNLPIKSLLLLW